MNLKSEFKCNCHICGWQGALGELFVDFNERDELIYRCPHCEHIPQRFYEEPAVVAKSFNRQKTRPEIAKRLSFFVNSLFHRTEHRTR